MNWATEQIDLWVRVTPNQLRACIETLNEDDVIEFIKELLCNVHVSRFPAIIEWMQEE